MQLVTQELFTDPISIVVVFERLWWSTAWTSGFSLALWLSPISMTPCADIHANEMYHNICFLSTHLSIVVKYIEFVFNNAMWYREHLKYESFMNISPFCLFVFLCLLMKKETISIVIQLSNQMYFPRKTEYREDSHIKE